MKNLSKNERQQFLKTKLIANKQRLASIDLMSELEHSQSLRSLGESLKSVNQIYYPQSQEIISEWYWPDAKIESDGWYKGEDRPDSYHYKAYAWENEVADYVATIDFSKYLESSAYLFIDHNFPLFVVNAKMIVDFIIQLFQKYNLGFALVEKNKAYGLIISHYVGYLEHDINPSEVVYEVSIWGEF